MTRTQPIQLPQSLMISEDGSFAYNTMTQRLPKLCLRLPRENNFPPEVTGQLNALAKEVVGGVVRSLQDPNAPDLNTWERYLASYRGKNWLEIPWFFGEVYFYRRVLESTGYFKPGRLRGIDPYEYQKNQGLVLSMNSIQTFSERVNQLQNNWDRSGCRTLLYFALWGNRVDLSLWSAQEGDRSTVEVDEMQAYLLADDTPTLTDYLTQHPHQRIDLIADNAGFELVCDLGLVDFLLGHQIADRVNLHLKNHPTFVSDAIVRDVYHTLEVFSTQEDPEIRKFGRRLQEHINADRLRLRDDPFWTSPLAAWDMPESLYQDLARSNLVLVKGDVNYRRLLGDRHWAFTTPFTEIVSYFPAPIAALRTLKSELAAGLPSHRLEQLNRDDRHWLTSGQWGVIQLGGQVGQ